MRSSVCSSCACPVCRVRSCCDPWSARLSWSSLRSDSRALRSSASAARRPRTASSDAARDSSADAARAVSSSHRTDKSSRSAARASVSISVSSRSPATASHSRVQRADLPRCCSRSRSRDAISAVSESRCCCKSVDTCVVSRSRWSAFSRSLSSTILASLRPSTCSFRLTQRSSISSRFFLR